MGSPTTPEKTPRLKSWKTRRSPTGEKSISSKKFLKETKAKNWERWKHWRFGFRPGLQCSNAFECWKMPFLKADLNLGEAHQLTLNRPCNIYKNWIVNAQWSISKILPVLDTAVDHAWLSKISRANQGEIICTVMQGLFLISESLLLRERQTRTIHCIIVLYMVLYNPTHIGEELPDWVKQLQNFTLLRNFSCLCLVVIYNYFSLFSRFRRCVSPLQIHTVFHK